MIAVQRAGPRTTVQDAGRPGSAHLGVPRSGAVDALSRQLANLLVGNADDAAVLETTLAGPRLLFEGDALVACTGARAPLVLDDVPVPSGVAVPVRAGQVLDVGRAAVGLRTYIAVAGGFDVAPVLGSRSTDTLSGLGPPVVASGAVLPVGVATGASAHSFAADLLGSVLEAGRRPVRLIVGPRADPLTAQAWEALCSREFAVTTASDRVGVRLSAQVSVRGRRGEVDRPADAQTEGMVSGAIQVPPDGQPIVLLADHAVTGGYPVVAVVATIDLPLIAQARPGTALRFTSVSVDEARGALRDQELRIAGLN
jgi:biotin-dependent carboxylase-like uncharacterized protein